MDTPVEPFATVDDLKERWPDIPPGGESHARVLLDDATQFILDMCPGALQAASGTRRRITCSVVRRAMQAEADSLTGVTSESLTTGPFAFSRSPANPNGDFFLTKQEKSALGCGTQKAFGTLIVDDTPAVTHRPWCSLMFGARYCSCGADLTGSEPLWE